MGTEVACVVVETNVAVCANGDSAEVPHATKECVLACVRMLRSVVSSLKGAVAPVIALDASGEIIAEYRRHLRPKGQPRVGDAFFFEVLQRQHSVACELVPLTPCEDDRCYEEFPSDPDLRTFDRSDRKFVVVGLRSKSGAVVVNALDSDWRNFAVPLARAGLSVQELCPDCLGGGESPPPVVGSSGVRRKRRR
jgi:hypothetical protein